MFTPGKIYKKVCPVCKKEFETQQARKQICSDECLAIREKERKDQELVRRNALHKVKFPFYVDNALLDFQSVARRLHYMYGDVVPCKCCDEGECKGNKYFLHLDGNVENNSRENTYALCEAHGGLDKYTEEANKYKAYLADINKERLDWVSK